MQKIRDFLFPAPPSAMLASVLLLVARIVFGLLFLNHGVAKWVAFESAAISFPDPLGVGSFTSLLLAIFAEVFCSVGFILGLLYRLSLIPMILTMCVAFFIIHGADPLSVKELSLVFLTVFVLMFLSGPGYFSIDSSLRRLFPKNDDTDDTTGDTVNL